MTLNERRAVKQFEKAQLKLAHAERVIAKVFHPRITAACKTDDIKELRQMLWEIPEESKHKIPLYQAILEIERERRGVGDRPLPDAAG
jgi:hypothetical protein